MDTTKLVVFKNKKQISQNYLVDLLSSSFHFLFLDIYFSLKKQSLLLIFCDYGVVLSFLLSLQNIFCQINVNQSHIFLLFPIFLD